MGKESGLKVLFEVGDGATPEVFNPLKGQKDTRMSAAANAVDVSDKTTGGWGSTISGTRSMTVSVSGLCDWGDTVLTQIETAFLAGAEIAGRFKLNENGDYYGGQLSITQFDVGGAHDGATEYSMTLSNAGEMEKVMGGGA